MTEHDAAMVDYRAATLATWYVALWISAAVSGAQCVVIWRGLRMIDRSNRAYAETAENQHRESDRRHAKAMAALAHRRRATNAQCRATDAMIEKQRTAREDQRPVSIAFPCRESLGAP